VLYKRRDVTITYDTNFTIIISAQLKVAHTADITLTILRLRGRYVFDMHLTAESQSYLELYHPL